MNFSEKLKILRKEKNLSQEQFSEIMNVSRQAVSKWESGQSFPDIDKLIDISNYFNVSIDSLIKDNSVDLNNESIKPITPESQNSILKSKPVRVTLSVLSAICIMVCLFGLTQIDQFRNMYQSILLVIYCIIGIVVSIYALNKIGKSI